MPPRLCRMRRLVKRGREEESWPSVLFKQCSSLELHYLVFNKLGRNNMCFANSLFVAASLLLILPYVRTDSSSTNCTKNQLGKVREKYQTCVQQKLPQMKKSRLAYFTDQKRCQIINTVSFWRASFLTLLGIRLWRYLYLHITWLLAFQKNLGFVPMYAANPVSLQ